MAFYYDKDGYRVEMPSTASPSVPTSQYYYDKDGYRVPMSSAKTSTATMPDFYYDQNGYRVEIPKTSDVEGLYSRYNELVGNAEKRYAQTGYRADYSTWKDQTATSTSELSSMSKNLRRKIDSYRTIYGDEYADSMSELLDGIDKGLVSLNDAANNDYKIFSQFADENEYNTALSTYEMQNKASTLSLDEIEEEKKKLKKAKKKVNNYTSVKKWAPQFIDDAKKVLAEELEKLGYEGVSTAEELEIWESVLANAENTSYGKLDVSKGTADLEALQAEFEKVSANRDRVVELRGNILQKNTLNLTEDKVKELEKEVKSLSLDGSADADTILVSYNKRVDELKKQISGLEKDLQSAGKVQSFNALGAVMDPTSEFYNPDFEKYVQEGASRFGNVVEGVKNGKTAEELGISKDDYYRYKQMTDDEVKLYNYYNSSYYDSEYHDSKKQKTLIGEQYIDELDKSFNSLTARAAQVYYNEVLKDKSDVEKIFSSVGANLERWGQNLGRAFDAYVVGSINPNHYGKEYYRGDISQGASAIAREDLGALGKVAYDALGAVSYMLPSIATSAIVGTVSKSAGAATFANALTMGVPVAGQAYEEMINLGYSEEQAKTYGVLAGASEFTTELFLNGAGKGLGKAVEPFADSIGKVMGRLAIEHGSEINRLIAQAGSEAVEEMVQEVLDPILRTIATGDLHDGATIEEMLYSGLLGGITAMGINTVDVAFNKVSQAVTNKNTEAFTQNEQVVFDKIVENRIAELEAKGEKVTSAEKKNIEKAVRQEFENGEISTSDIEEALGEAFFGVGESDKRILSSYRETALRGEKFSADLSKYSEKQRGVVQSAIDSGILNNSSRTHKFVDFVAKLAEDKGVNFSFINNQKLKESGFAIEGKDVAGYVKGNDIAVNIDSSKSLNSIVGHEIAHVLEGTELYDVLATAVKNYATTKGEWNSRLKSTAELYIGISEDAEGELVADLIGDYLFTDSKFLERLSVEHQNLFQRLWSEVKYLCRIATAGSKEARQLEKVKKAFEDAYRNTKPAEKSTDTESGGVRYAINRNFYNEFDAWDKRDSNVSFTIGNTSEALKSIGMKNQEITVRSGTIINKLNKHPEMSIEKFRQIPELLENPVIVQFSDAIDPKTGKPKYDSRITVLGELYADTTVDGKIVQKPILVSLELLPTNQKKTVVLDISVVTSAYAKGAIQEYINNNSILYIDPNKKRTNKWLSLNRLQLPVGENQYGSIRRITYSGNKVKIENSKNKSDFQVALEKAGVVDTFGNIISKDERKNSLVGENQSREAVGDYNVYGRDVKLASDEAVPVQERQNNVFTEERDSSFEDFDSQSREDVIPLDDADEIPRQRGDQVGFETENTVEVINDQDLQYITNILKDTLYLNPRQVGEVKKIVRDYSSAEHPSKTRLKAEIQSRFGTVKFAEKVEEIEAIKKELRSRDIKVSDAIKNDIADYGDFYRSHYRKLSLKESGTPVDSLYMELTNNYPDFFPEDIINPSDQLQRIAEVVDMDTYNRGEYEVDEDTIQKAVDVIAEGVGRYRRVKKTSKATATTEERVFQRRQDLNSKIRSEVRSSNREYADYTQNIDNLMAEYESMNPNSAEAIELQYRIQELTADRKLEEIRSKERIKGYQKSLKRVDDGTYATAIQRKSKQAELMEWAKELLGDTSMWKDKKLGVQYMVNTLRRNLFDIVRDKNGKVDYKKADEIYDATAGTYNHNEALLNKESARIKKQFADMKINPVESEYIQMLGEFRHNPETALEEQDVMNFYEKNHKKIDERKVEAAIELARKVYDDLFERVNVVLREHGMKEIPYRKGYFPHFVEEKLNLVQKILNWNKENKKIPDSIIGLTEFFAPPRSWQSFNKHREGDTTDYDFLKGLDRYVQGSLDWIYHIEDIQKRRAIENYIRYTHSEKGVQEQIDEIERSDEYDADQAEEQRRLIFAKAENSIGRFLDDFRRQTNTLAGKNHTLDRTAEAMANRQVYSVLNGVQRRVSANLVVGSLTAGISNLTPIPQSWVGVSPIRSFNAMGEAIQNFFVDDGTTEKSDFLTNRLRASEKLDKTKWDKVIDKFGIVMEVVDNFSAQTIWRSKYNQNIDKGMNEAEAIKDADQFAENVMAGRSRGNMPTLFNSSVFRVITAFQLEVNNQYGFFFKDAPRDLKNEGIGKLIKGYVAATIGTFIFNEITELLFGRRVALDPLGIIKELLKDLGVIGDDDDKEDSVENTIGNLADNIKDELPFTVLLGGEGGRIPVSSMIPYDDLWSVFSKAISDFKNENWINLAREWSKPIFYGVLPVGGGQFKKMLDGGLMYYTNEDRPIAGSYSGSGKLRFPAEKDFFSVLQNVLFGQYSSSTARDYFDEGRSPLTDKQLNVFVQMGEDMTIQEYWDFLDEISAINKAKKNDKSLDAIKMKVEYIVSLDLPLSKKNILVNSILNRKDPVDLQGFGELSGFAEWDFSMKNPEKYQFLKDNGISYQLYAYSEDTKESYGDDYQWYKSNPEKVTLSKAVTKTVVEYREITKRLYSIKADKDVAGNPISGSAKEKKLEYINSLDDLEYGAKLVLYKDLYPSDDSVNEEIIEYINSLDLTAAEKKTILKELKLG